MTNLAAKASALLKRRYGNAAWDGIVRASGVVALVALPVSLYLEAGELTGFVLVTMWVNGPLAPFLPATYEPILMLFGRMYPPLLIATLGIVGLLYVEFLNYHLYRRVLHLKKLRRMRESAVLRRLVNLFGRAPFFTVWICSWSPLPYWSVRILSPLAGYPVGRHLLATFLGRFPRLWFFAALGLYWHISAGSLLMISAVAMLLALGVWATKRHWAHLRPFFN